jgi:FAD:protein FMN transferase
MTAVAAAAPAQDTFRVFGTTATLLITEASALPAARRLADAEFAAVDLACSRFRPDSELSALNAAGGATVRISELFAELLGEALRAARLTDGAVDPTCGRALAELGYDRDFELLEPAPAAAPGTAGPGPASPGPAGPGPAGSGPAGSGPAGSGPAGSGPASSGPASSGPASSGPASSGPASSGPASSGPASQVPPARAVPGWRSVQLDTGPLRATLARGAQLDLGATAKARAADRCAAAIAGQLGCGVLVSLGGDIAVAGPVPAGGWRIRVTDDHAAGPDAAGQTVSIRSGGLATSSTTVRAWARDGRRMHHIVDPATGEPARSCWRTVSVAAGSCTDANAASTAAIVRGAAAIGWLQDLSLPARLVREDGSVAVIAGWPDEPEPVPPSVPAPGT